MKGWIRILIVAVLLLIILGAVLVFSASGTYSEVKFNSFYHLFKQHLWKVIGAVGAMVVFAIIPYEYYKKYSKPLMLGTVVLLFLTLLFAPKLKGAARWIDLGLVRFQPSELAKLILMMHLSVFIEKKGDLIKSFHSGYRYALVWIALVCGLVIIQPNVSTSMIILITSFALLYVGGSSFKHIAGTLGTAGVIGGAAMMLFSHSRSRVLGFIESLKGHAEPNIQVMQAKIGLGSGGLFGLGIGQSRQSDLFLPESYGDFIFSILGEEFGFIGALVVLALYFTIFFTGIVIAKNAKDKFGQLLGFGIVFNIVLSAFINAAVVMGIVPTTGITLPFLSFGGTSIILYSISIGILINIGISSVMKKEEKSEAIA